MKEPGKTFVPPLPFARAGVVSLRRLLFISACVASAVCGVCLLCQDQVVLLTIWLHRWMRDSVFYNSFPYVWTGVLLVGLLVTLVILTRWLYRHEVARSYRLILVAEDAGTSSSGGQLARAREFLARPTEFIETFLLEQMLTATERLVLSRAPLERPGSCEATDRAAGRLARLIVGLSQAAARGLEALPGLRVLRTRSGERLQNWWPAGMLSALLSVGVWLLPTYQSWLERLAFMVAITFAVSAGWGVGLSLRMPALPPLSPLDRFLREWTVQAREVWLAEETIQYGARQIEESLWPLWSAADGELFANLGSPGATALDPALREAQTFLAGLGLEAEWIRFWNLEENLAGLKQAIRELVRARLGGCLRAFYAVRLLALWRAAYWDAGERGSETCRDAGDRLVGALRDLAPLLPDGLSGMVLRVCRAHEAGRSVTLDSYEEWHRYREELHEQLSFAVQQRVKLPGEVDEFVCHPVLLIDVALLPVWRVKHKELGRLAVRTLGHCSAAAEDSCQLGNRTAARGDEELAGWFCLSPLRGGREKHGTLGASAGVARVLAARYGADQRGEKRRQHLTGRYLREALPVLYSFYPVRRSQVLGRFLPWEKLAGE
jgi:hypothetical protein